MKKAGPGAPEFDATQQKEFFREAVEMFRNTSVPATPRVAERMKELVTRSAEHSQSCGKMPVEGS